MNPNNPYEGRWKWWYSRIADEMLSDPGIKTKEIALNLGRGYSTVALIQCTDSFKTYYEARKAQMQSRLHDKIASKIARVAEASLDAISDKLEKQRDLVPMSMLESLAKASLDRLGFAPASAPSVVVQNNVVDNSKHLSVSPQALEEARANLRMMEEMKERNRANDTMVSGMRVIESAPARHTAEPVEVEMGESSPLFVEDDDAEGDRTNAPAPLAS